MNKEDRIKQIVVVRRDLKMTVGKIVSQSCHASISFLVHKCQTSEPLSDTQKEWIAGSFFKICLGVDSEKELLDIYDKAKSMGLDVHLITDQGHSVFNGVPTNTCLALGPDYSSKINIITGHLKLL